MKNYFLGIDQGTTSSRAIIYDSEFNTLASHAVPFKQIYPKADWVEHDPNEIWNSVLQSLEGALKKIQDPDFAPHLISSIGITNQRETFVLWDRQTLNPIGNAIVWQCRRSKEICEKLSKSKDGKTIKQITGLVLDPYFSGTKLKWRLQNEKGLLARAKKGEVCFGTIDTFLLAKLTNGNSFLTEPSNASRTMLMDIKTCEWSSKALKVLGVPLVMLPKIVSSDADFGKTAGLKVLPDGISIHGILGDQQAALFGQECLEWGESKITYGTGAFFLINTSKKLKRTKSGLSTVAWKIGTKVDYALEGSVFIAGAAVQWLRDGLGLIQKSSEIESLAKSVSDSDGVFFIPALTGLGAPNWAPHARGLIGGLSRRSTKAHLARATLEGIAYSVGDTFKALQKDSGKSATKIRADGGAAANDLLLEIQSSDLQVKVQRPKDLESTARGAVLMAALGCGFLKQKNQIKGLNKIDQEFLPKLSKKAALEKRKIWERRKKALIQGAY